MALLSLHFFAAIDTEQKSFARVNMLYTQRWILVMTMGTGNNPFVLFGVKIFLTQDILGAQGCCGTDPSPENTSHSQPTPNRRTAP